MIWWWLVLGCGGADDPPVNRSGEVIVADAARILDVATLDALTGISADVTTLTFDGSTPLLDGIVAGDVLVSDVHANAPDGLLRRVVSVERQGSRTTITAGPAGLTDVLEQGSMQAVLDLGSSGLAERAGPDALLVGFNDEVLFDGDGDASTTFDQVRVDGSVGLDPELVIDIDISGFSLQTATIELSTELDANLAIDAGRHASFAESFPLQTIRFTPITVFIGPIPVVFTPKLVLEVNIDGSVTAGMATTLQVEADAAVGFGYANGSFGPIVELDPTGSLDVNAFEEGGSETLRVGLAARYDVAAYGMAGVYVGLEPYSRVGIDTLGDPWWQVWAGVEGVAGAYAKLDIDFLFFDIHVDIFDYQTDPLGHEVLIASAPGAAPALADVVEEVTWARTLGGDKADHPVALAPLPDGGALLAAGSLSASPTPEDALIVRLDRLGNPVWSTALLDLGPATSLVPTPAGLAMTAGNVGGAAAAATVVGLDLNGIVRWAAELDHADGLAPHQLTVASDGSLFVSGAVGAIDDADVWVSRLSPEGAVLWSVVMGGPGEDLGLAAAPTPSGGLLLAASTQGPSVTFTATWVGELDADGNVLWQTVLDGDDSERPRQVVALTSGDWAVTGDDGGDAMVLRLSPTGELVWARRVDGGTLFDNTMGATAADGDRVVVAGTTGLGDDTDVWLFRVDDDGNVDWASTYGGSFDDRTGGASAYAYAGRPMVADPEGGFLIAASTDSFAPDPDMWLLRVGETGSIDFDTGSGATHLNTSASADDRAVSTSPGTWVPASLPVDVTEVELQPLSVQLQGTTQAIP